MKLHETISRIAPIVGQNIKIQRIEHALTNATYLVSNELDSYCLRLNNPQSEQLGIDRSRETTILELISEEPWAPTIVDSQRDWMLSRWKQGETFRPQEQQDFDLLIDLFRTIQKVASAPLIKTKPIHIAEQIEFLLSNAQNLVPEFCALSSEVCTRYHFPNELKLCFHDWHPGNLLHHDTDIVMIDWEYAALGDPIIDCACLISGFKLNDPQITTLTNLLNISPSDLELALCLTSLLSLSWYMVRFPQRDWQPQQLQWITRWKESR